MYTNNSPRNQDEIFTRRSPRRVNQRVDGQLEYKNKSLISTLEKLCSIKFPSNEESTDVTNSAHGYEFSRGNETSPMLQQQCSHVAKSNDYKLICENEVSSTLECAATSTFSRARPTPDALREKLECEEPKRPPRNLRWSSDDEEIGDQNREVASTTSLHSSVGQAFDSNVWTKGFQIHPQRESSTNFSNSFSQERELGRLRRNTPQPGKYFEEAQALSRQHEHELTGGHHEPTSYSFPSDRRGYDPIPEGNHHSPFHCPFSNNRNRSGSRDHFSVNSRSVSISRSHCSSNHQSNSYQQCPQSSNADEPNPDHSCINNHQYITISRRRSSSQSNCINSARSRSTSLCRYINELQYSSQQQCQRSFIERELSSAQALIDRHRSTVTRSRSTSRHCYINNIRSRSRSHHPYDQAYSPHQKRQQSSREKLHSPICSHMDQHQRSTNTRRSNSRDYFIYNTRSRSRSCSRRLNDFQHRHSSMRSRSNHHHSSIVTRSRSGSRGYYIRSRSRSRHRRHHHRSSSHDKGHSEVKIYSPTQSWGRHHERLTVAHRRSISRCAYNYNTRSTSTSSCSRTPHHKQSSHAREQSRTTKAVHNIEDHCCCCKHGCINKLHNRTQSPHKSMHTSKRQSRTPSPRKSERANKMRKKSPSPHKSRRSSTRSSKSRRSHKSRDLRSSRPPLRRTSQGWSYTSDVPAQSLQELKPLIENFLKEVPRRKRCRRVYCTQSGRFRVTFAKSGQVHIGV